jgi:hypothetical protein
VWIGKQKGVYNSISLLWRYVISIKLHHWALFSCTGTIWDATSHFLPFRAPNCLHIDTTVFCCRQDSHLHKIKETETQMSSSRSTNTHDSVWIRVSGPQSLFSFVLVLHGGVTLCLFILEFTPFSLPLYTPLS